MKRRTERQGVVAMETIMVAVVLALIVIFGAVWLQATLRGKLFETGKQFGDPLDINKASATQTTFSTVNKDESGTQAMIDEGSVSSSRVLDTAGASGLPMTDANGWKTGAYGGATVQISETVAAGTTPGTKGTHAAADAEVSDVVFKP